MRIPAGSWQLKRNEYYLDEKDGGEDAAGK